MSDATKLTIPVDAAQLRLYADASRRHGTQDKFIDLALEWADKAQAYVEQQQTRIADLERAMGIQAQTVVDQEAALTTLQAAYDAQGNYKMLYETLLQEGKHHE